MIILLRTLLIVYTAALILTSPVIHAASLVNVPLNPELSDFNRETYRFIHRLLNKRVLPGITRGSLPLTRGQVVSSLMEVARQVDAGEITLSAIDQGRLNTFLTFYREAGELPEPAQKNGAEGKTQNPPGRRLHLMTLADENYRFSLDLRASQRVITRFVDNLSSEQPAEGNMHITTLFPHIYGQFEESFAFTADMAYRFLYGDIFDDVFPDESKYRQLEGELKNRTAINSYLKFKMPWFELQFGQDNLQWGPGISRKSIDFSKPYSD